MDWADFPARPAPAGNPGVSQDPAAFPFVALTRVIAYRNFSGRPFVVSAPPKACAAAADLALGLISRRGGHDIRRLAECPTAAIRFLRERHLLPQRFAAFPGKKGFKYLATAPGGAEWVLVNEVEHMAFGRMAPGRVGPVDFPVRFPPPREDGDDPSLWARNARLGFLASDPARIGSGLSAELLVHLPGLALSRRLEHALRFLSASAVSWVPASAGSGAPVEASPAEAGLFWLKSRGGLGKSPAEVYGSLCAAVDPVLRSEREAQLRCLEKHRKRLEDRAKQSLHLLSGARTLAYGELLAHASLARLGAYLGLLGSRIPSILEELRITAGSGHLTVTSGRELAKEEEDFLRADVVRSGLEAYSGENT